MPRPRKPTKRSETRKFMEHFWTVTSDGQLLILDSGSKSASRTETARFSPVAVISDRASTSGERPGHKLVFTLPKDKKLRLYLEKFAVLHSTSSLISELVHKTFEDESNICKYLCFTIVLLVFLVKTCIN